VSTSSPANFWRSFEQHAVEIRELLSRDEMNLAFSAVEEVMRSCGLDLAFDLTTAPLGGALLVLTPEGDPVQAQIIDELVDAAPPIEGWTVVGRRERKPVSDALAFVRHIYGIDISGARFDVTEAEGKYQVTMHEPACGHLTEEERIGLLATYLDHALGEDLVMRRIAQMDIHVGSGGAMSGSEMVQKIIAEAS
jgi:hypothetical protein